MYNKAALSLSHSEDVPFHAIQLPKTAQPIGPMITEMKLVIPVYTVKGNVIPAIPVAKLRAIVDDV